MYNMNANRLAFLVLATSVSVLAHGDEDHTLVDTTNPGTGNSTITDATGMSDMMMMTPYFHWMANADALFFKAWVPRTPGALAGACLGLFCLAVFERFLAGAKGLLEAWWRRRLASNLTRALVTPDNASTHSHTKSVESGTYFLNAAAAPLVPAFEPAHDVVRGVMQAVQSLIGFFLMLSVMTYNAAFLISVVLGLGAGEIVFARLGRSGAHPGCVAARTG